MHKSLHIIAFLLVSLILCGCVSSAGTVLSEDTSLPSESIPETLPFEVTLPAKYSSQYKSKDEVSIILNGQVIGGIICTGLDANCLTEAKSEERTNYLNSLASPPIRQQYFLMLWNNRAYVSLTRENVETGEIQEQSHCIFEKESICFDIWIDTSLVKENERDSIFNSIIEGS